MFDIVISFFKGILYVLAIPLAVIVVIAVIFVIFCAFWFVYYTIKGKRLKKGSRVKIKKDGFFKKIFIKLPQRFVLDTFNRDPDFFKTQGLIIFER